MSNPGFRSVVTGSGVAAAVLLALGGATVPVTAGAQQASTSGAEIDEVVVTGSRIRRKDETSMSPIFTMDLGDIQSSGIVSMGALLQELPSVGSSLNSNGTAGVSHGTSSLNLRNLGANRNLILVNGRRWVNGAGTRGFRDFVDMNTIPMVAAERVEVLKDGATAVYGSDAIAGVMNIITFKRFDGLEARAYMGSSSRNDGETVNADVLWGKAGDWGSVMLSGNYSKADPIYVEDRAFSRVPLNGLSTSTERGRFRGGGQFGGARFTRVDGASGNSLEDFRPFVDPDDRYNGQTGQYLTGPLELAGLFGQARVRLAGDTELVLEGLFNNRKSDQRFAPVVPTIRGSEGFVIPADHPYNPFGVQFSGSSLDINRVLVENDFRYNEQDVDTMRVAAGLEGTLANGWAWDAFYSFAKNDAVWLSRNQIDRDALALGLGPNDRCAANNCTPINIFGTITEEMIDYINFTGRDENGTRQSDFVANLTGDLLELPAGSLAFASGVEYRKEEGYDRPDSIINSTPVYQNNRRTTSAPRNPTDADYDLWEAYLELSVPVIADRPMFQSLELDAAVRYSDYSTFGDTTNAKFGLAWRPVQDLLVRGTIAEGFRAPSINELYSGLRETNLPAVDPCSGGGAGLPGCAGVPSTYDQADYGGTTVRSLVGGNPDLQPETSDNLSYGFVFTPAALDGFSISMDWYDVEINDAISSFGSQRLLNLCANTGQRCEFVTRGTQGEIVRLIDGPINLDRIKTSGLDTVVRYDFQAKSAGRFRLMLDVSYLDSLVYFFTNEDGSIRVDDRTGKSLFREAYPRVRGNASVNWARNQWTANWTMRYQGTTNEGPEPATKGDIPSRLYHDVWAAYEMEAWKTTVTLGIENLFDELPPVSIVNTNINFDINTYNPRGAFGYLRIKTKF
ncbi:MAG: TonB-dependent receptor plug domain-containing protein [Steroidobacteraceae bacterium]